MSMSHLAAVNRAYQNCKIRLEIAQDMWANGLLSDEEIATANREFSSLQSLLRQAKLDAGIEEEA